MILIINLVLIRIFSNSFSGVFQKKLSKSFYASYINTICYFILTLFCLLGAKFFDFSNFEVFKFALFSGLIGAIGNIFQIKALNLGELSILAPINSYKIIFSLIFSFLILKEIPSMSAFLGIFLIIAGSYIIFETTREGFSYKLFLKKDIQYRILAVLFTSLEAVFIKNMIIVSNELTALFFWGFSSFLFSLIIMKLNSHNFDGILKNALCLIIGLSLTMLIMQFSTNILFKIMNVSYALSLFQLSSILSVFLGYKFFREKNIFKKLLGSLVMIFGAIIIILNN